MGPYRKNQSDTPPGAFVAGYLEHLSEQQAPDVSRHADVLSSFEAYLRFRETETGLLDVDPLVVQGYVTGMKVRGASNPELHECWTILRDFFDYLIEAGEWDWSNPVLGTLEPGADPTDPSNWPFLR